MLVDNYLGCNWCGSICPLWVAPSPRQCIMDCCESGGSRLSTRMDTFFPLCSWLLMGCDDFFKILLLCNISTVIDSNLELLAKINPFSLKLLCQTLSSLQQKTKTKTTCHPQPYFLLYHLKYCLCVVGFSDVPLHICPCPWLASLIFNSISVLPHGSYFFSKLKSISNSFCGSSFQLINSLCALLSLLLIYWILFPFIIFLFL